MKIVIFLLSFLPFIFSCSNKKDKDPSVQVKFDKLKWQAKEGDIYPYRDEMLNNLIDSVTLKGLHHDSIINLLGHPDKINEGHLYYNVSRKNLGDVTLGTKTFVIKLKSDSTVEWRKIHGG